MHEVALIGGIPSSGSTLLMRLLGSEPDFSCLPETGLFSHGQYLLDYGGINPECTDLGLSIPWLDTGAKVSEAIGVDAKDLKDFFSCYGNSFEFVQDRFGVPGCLLAEKTPENIFAFDVYLSRFPEARVVATSRGALGAVQSLMRRGFSMYSAYLIWFSHAYVVCELLQKYSQQVLLCRYESLTADPGKMTAIVAAHLRLGREGATGGGGCHGRDHELLLESSSRVLEATAWNLSASGKVEQREPVNYLGNVFRVMFERVAFEVVPGRFVRGHAAERFLCGEARGLETFSEDRMQPIDFKHGCLMTRTLFAKHAMCVAGC